MRVIDLTHPIAEGMPVFPGTEPPVIQQVCTIDADGFDERRLSICSHTGTHVDAPAHLVRGGRSVDQYDAESFVGPCCVLDVRDCGSFIPLEAIAASHARLRQADFALLWTGWDAHWGLDRYLEGYPTLALGAAQWLAGLSLKGVGMDTLSPDPITSTGLPVHHVFMEQEMLIFENLTRLSTISEQATFAAAPLPLRDGDGCPVRAVAMQE